jgi:hypothetical protein
VQSLRAALASAAIVGFVTIAVAAEEPIRVRGEIQSLSGNTLNVRSYEGKPVELMLDSQTRYESVVQVHLSDIKHGDFVGASAPHFPASMRGNRGWPLRADADRNAANATPGGATGPTVNCCD